MAMTPGIFGGRFDPPHLGHLALARAAVEQLGIHELEISVVAAAAHKPSIAPAADRLAMAELTFAELDATVSLEAHAYTVDALEARRGDDDPIFLLGADELADFSAWKQPERVLELARLGVAQRPGYPTAEASERVLVFDLEPHGISSSDIRERIRRGEPIDSLVVPAVAAYISDNGLYGRE